MIKDTIQAVKDLLSNRAYAYKAVFRKDDRYAAFVLRDLAKFCRAHASTFAADPRAHAAMEGRREVWLRIQEHLHLDDNELMSIHEVKFRPKENK